MLGRITHWLVGSQAENLVPSHFGFDVPIHPYLCLMLLIAMGAGMGLYYWPKLGATERRYRATLVALRVGVVMLVLFLLLDPAIVARKVKPGEQFVILLFDDSKSMRIRGEDGLSRGERLVNTYEAAREDFEAKLSAKHQLARYRVGVGIEPLKSLDDLRFDQPVSDLLGGTVNALRDLEGAHISAVVLFSDGVQQCANAQAELEDLDASIPVFTVGVDDTSQWRDVELTHLSVKRTDFDKSPVVLAASVHSVGLAGHTAVVEAVLGNRVVKLKTIEITDDVQDHEVRLEFVPDRKGWIEYEVRVRLQSSERKPSASGQRANDRIEENNTRHFAINNTEKTYRVLYVSARPSWENKFLGRALSGDDQLKMTSLIAISNAERKFVFRGKKSSLANPLFQGFDEDQDRPRYDEQVFLRLGASENELVSGYPTSADELYGYHLIIWGDVEREFFTTAQLELTKDFVEKRGGSLLLLGGPASFTEGNYAGSIIEGMLPVKLYEAYVNTEVQRAEIPFMVRPTMEGTLSGAWSLDSDSNENDALWEEMPTLYGLNRFPFVRPGATVMAHSFAPSGDARNAAPVFAMQPYGEGRCGILATSDTWQWRMRIDEADDRHERLWRQIVRNFVHDSPEPMLLRSKEDRYTQSTSADLEFLVRDKQFESREGLQTILSLVSPSGQESTMPVDESIQETGLYTSRFFPEETGLYKIEFTALNEQDEVVGRLEEAVLVEPDSREFQHAQYDRAFLRSIAEKTGGVMYAIDSLAELARAIPLPARDDAEEIRLHLWHLPAFYVALLLMMAGEWFLRRRKGQP